MCANQWRFRLWFGNSHWASLSGVSATAAGSLLYALGGYDSLGTPAGMSAFDPVTKAWTAKEPPPVLAGFGPARNPLGFSTTANVNGKIYQVLMTGTAVYNPPDDLK